MFKTDPFPHQLAELEASQDLPFRALFWEQGTGKTKLAIDTAAHLFRTGKIDALLVVAPNGVHDAWVLDELPAHCPVPYVAHAWSTRRAGTRGHTQELNALMDSRGKLRVLALSYDAMMTTAGSVTMKLFLERNRCLHVLDESQRIKTPGAKRTIRALASSKYSQYRRVLSGTPITNKPFDVYSQLKFLDPTFWPRNGFASYEAFKTFFGLWEERVNGQTGVRFRSNVGFQNISILNRLVDSVSSRVMKDDVLDLPPKLYSRIYFDLSPEQTRAYEELRREMILQLDSGQVITAELAVTMILRLQQVACGFVGTDHDRPPYEFPANPRLHALRNLLEDTEGSALIFCRFRHDVDAVTRALGAACVRHDGTTSQEDRAEARRRFQEGTSWYLVGTPDTCATGFTLHKARTVVYYSNSFNLEHRLQSEDRAHRIGQGSSVRYVDLVAKGTVDERIVASLRAKRGIAAEVLGDKLKEWI